MQRTLVPGKWSRKRRARPPANRAVHTSSSAKMGPAYLPPATATIYRTVPTAATSLDVVSVAVVVVVAAASAVPYYTCVLNERDGDRADDNLAKPASV